MAESCFDVRLLHTTDFAVIKLAHTYGVLGGLLGAALIQLARQQAQH